MSTAIPTLLYCGMAGVMRQPVPTALRAWTVSFANYTPTAFEMDFSGKEWADPPIDNTCFRFNELDGGVDRRSHTGPYQVKDGYPLNPGGRTGVRLRGILGRWGPNHAADPIVTRWKRDASGRKIIEATTQRPILQFVAIRRRDTKEWALPGGMVDPGERVTKTLWREFAEEALNSGEKNAEEVEEARAKLQELFSGGQEVYRGLVDDRRNTDNAWMETTCFLFHDPSGHVFDQVPLEAGDDAVGVAWKDADKSLALYASHSQFVEKAAALLSSHF